jgi:hypothetical protein
LLELLEKDESEIRRLMAENSRNFCVLRSKEKELQIKCDALEETDLNIIKVILRKTNLTDEII